MKAVRLWSVRNPRLLQRVYDLLERGMVGLHPLFERIGYHRVEGPVSLLERGIKGFLFDCRMCGHCVLDATGMSCPMNCPKGLRNGPCGGVRADGACEVEPGMRCVWVLAGEGVGRLGTETALAQVQTPVDSSLAGRSSWLRVARDPNLRHSAASRVGA